MPKQKTHKGLTKRVKITARGKILRAKANKGHLMSTKSSKRRRRLGKGGFIKTCDKRTTLRLLALK